MWILWHHFISLGECSHRSISSNDSHTGENPPPCSITHHTLSWPPFAPVTAFKPIYPAVFALFFLRSQVPSLIPTPATSYEWLEFTGHGRSYHCSSRACRSCLLSRRRMDSFVNFDTIQVPCVADPGRLKTLSRFFGMHIAPSDYILYGVVVIVPGTCIVPYMMQIPVCFVFAEKKAKLKYSATAAGLQSGPHRYFTFEKDRTYLPSALQK